MDLFLQTSHLSPKGPLRTRTPLPPLNKPHDMAAYLESSVTPCPNAPQRTHLIAEAIWSTVHARVDRHFRFQSHLDQVLSSRKRGRRNLPLRSRNCLLVQQHQGRSIGTLDLTEQPLPSRVYEEPQQLPQHTTVARCVYVIDGRLPPLVTRTQKG